MQAAEYEIIRNILVIHLKEDLDHHTAMAVRETADALLDRSKAKHILFDFSEIGFCDSSGIGVIMGRYKKVIFTGGRIGVMGVTESIDRILNYAGLYRILERFSSVDEAFRKPLAKI